MSFYISKAELKVATVTMKYNLRKLGPRQQKSLQRMVNSGVIKGYSIPAMIAKHVLTERKLPFVFVITRGYISFKDLPLDKKHPLREGLLYANALESLRPRDPEDTHRSTRDKNRQRSVVHDVTASWVWVARESLKAFDTVSMDYGIELGDTVEIEINK